MRSLRPTSRTKRPVAELFRATEGSGRADPTGRLGPLLSLTSLRPATVAITLIGAVAVAALALSVWQLTSGAPNTNWGISQPVLTTPIAEVTRAARAVVTQPVPPLAEKPKAKRAKLFLTAARGDCWLEVRVGSARGEVLFVGTLEQGQSLRFAKQRLWIAFGAGGHLDVTVNGRDLERFPIGTANVIVTAKGVRAPRNA